MTDGFDVLFEPQFCRCCSEWRSCKDHVTGHSSAICKVPCVTTIQEKANQSPSLHTLLDELISFSPPTTSLPEECDEISALADEAYSALNDSLVTWRESSEDSLDVQLKSLHCAKCSKTYNSHSGFTRHLKLVHKIRVSSPYNCSVCSRKFWNQVVFEDHMKSMDHYKNSNFHVCNECGKILANRGNFRDHWRKFHRTSDFLCRDCKKRFETKEILLQHRIDAHNHRPKVQEDIFCHFCAKNFKVKGALVKHLVKHFDERKFKCDQCAAGFKRSRDLKEHMDALHSNKKDFLCEICFNAFSTKIRLRNHYRAVHAKFKFSDKFKCNQCDTVCISKGDLRRHYIIHNVAKHPFTCPVCQAGFKAKESMQRHLFTHSSTKLYSCTSCPSSYHRSSVLRRHIQRVHGIAVEGKLKRNKIIFANVLVEQNGLTIL